MKASERRNRLGVQAFGVHTNIDEAVAHLAEESPQASRRNVSRFSLAGLTFVSALRPGCSILIWASELGLKKWRRLRLISGLSSKAWPTTRMTPALPRFPKGNVCDWTCFLPLLIRVL